MRIARSRMGWLALLALSGCATNNGLPPDTPAYHFYAPNAEASLSAPAPSVYAQPRPPVPPRSLSAVPPAAVPPLPTSSVPPKVTSGLETPPVATQAPAASGPLAAADFPSQWQADLRQARTESAHCAELSGEAQSRCWQSVSSWAQGRAARYHRLSREEVGARAEQVKAAARFFDVTSQWASACSSLSASACAQSPLIGQMQQWKESVGLNSRP